MKSEQILKDKMRSHFFELISNISNYSYEEILYSFTSQLGEILHSNCELYLYNYWDLTYKLISASKEDSYLNEGFSKDSQAIEDTFNLLIKDHLSSDKKEVFSEVFKGIRLFIAPLKSGHKEQDFLILKFKEGFLSDELLYMIKDETDQFLKIVNYYNNSQVSNEKNMFLYDMSSNFYSVTSLTSILKEVIDSLKQLYPKFDYYLLLSQDHDADSTLPVKTIEYSGDERKRASLEAFTTGEVQFEYQGDEGETSLYAPLTGSQGVYGVLQIVTPQIIDFPKKEIEFITRFAKTAGNAIENATLYQHSNHLVADLQLINDVTHKLNSNLQLSEIITIMKKQIMSLGQGTEVGFVYYTKKSNKKFDILEGGSPYFMSKDGHSFTHYLVEQMKGKKEAIFSGNFQKRYPALPYRSMMVIPMLSAETMLGFVIIMHKEPAFFSFANFKLMKSLIQHSALAFTNTVLKDQLEKAVITDYMTKLYSRKYLDDLIHMHMEYDNRGALVLFDIDDFKNINDTYGHHVGDKVIIQVANIMMESSRAADIPTRWGGEEIAIYLPHVNLEAGVKLAERIRKKVAEITNPRVTLSSGVATWMANKNDSVTDLFIRADEALYKAKETGKNRVITERFNN